MDIDVGERNRDNAFVAWTRIQAGRITLKLLAKSQTGIPTPFVADNEKRVQWVAGSSCPLTN